MRRDKNDEKWKEVKRKVHLRDKGKCRFIKVCSLKESIMLEKIAPKPLLNRLDCCHVFPVSLYDHMVYMEENVVLMNRWVHHNLDDCKHPITGEEITKEERNSYWQRIVGDNVYYKLLQLSDRKSKYGESETN